MHKVAAGVPGDRLLLLGNEAIARGAIEAGVRVVTGYPGTPSSEVVEALMEASTDLGFYAEWSVNEKVSFELAAGAALTGSRALAVMKGAGLNVVMDLFLTLPYGGTRGGMVVVVADDPGAHYSSNEQDSRVAAQWAMIPCLEPESHQEAKDMTKMAFALSERLELPVMVRSVTRISHSSGVVLLSEVEPSGLQTGFNKHWKLPYRWNVYGPPGPTAKHAWQLERLPQMDQEAEALEFNDLVKGQDRLGVLACGMGAAYVREALHSLGLEDRLWLLKTGLAYPIAAPPALDMLSHCDQVLVVEEGGPVVETQLRLLAQAEGITTRIHGRQFDAVLPQHGELSTATVEQALAQIAGIVLSTDDARLAMKHEMAPMVTPRSSALCAGCSHLGTYWALREALSQSSEAIHIVNGDIGCYEQAGYGVKGQVPEPSDAARAHHDSSVVYDFLDTLYVMGSGVSMAQGQVRSGYGDGQVVAVAGDSTFFHTCLPGVLNAVWNGTKLTFVVMDNYWTSMTGHQPSPASMVGAGSQGATTILIEDVARSLGVESVQVVDPYDLQETTAAIRKALAFAGVAVVVARGECMLQVLRRQRVYKPPYEVTDDCLACGECLKLGCPAITFSENGAGIEGLLCVGCDICAQLCPYEAIVPTEEAK
ncbi:MAG TPA: thiamine pyrophosphate-dependent enzyme [Anaerolineae bacterium]|nr:thiamine pyrophosphate-dependent enzyme [Anaerolineae bacterium]